MTKRNYRHLLVEITKMFFKSREFKIFDVSPEGYFISLGLTTSLETLEKLSTVLRNSDYGFSASVRELKSVRIDDNEYINTVTESIPKKFDSGQMIKEGSVIYGEESKDKFPEITEFIETSEGGWDEYGILCKPDSNPVVYYKKVNYMRQDEGSELRLGIYVVPENID